MIQISIHFVFCKSLHCLSLSAQICAVLTSKITVRCFAKMLSLQFSLYKDLTFVVLAKYCINSLLSVDIFKSFFNVRRERDPHPLVDFAW